MLSREPVENVIHEGIKRGITVTLEEGCFRATLILVMCGIDALAYISLPEDRNKVMRADFVAWADRYVNLDGITGLELYSARCGLLHEYGIESDLTRNKNVRLLGYFTDRDGPGVIENATLSTDFVLVSVEALVSAFFAGVDRFLIEVFGDPARRPVAEARLRKQLHQLQQVSPISR